MMKKNFFAMIITGIMVMLISSMVMASDTPLSTGSKAGTTETGEGSFSADMEINTPYYSLEIPDSWMGSFTIETVSNQTGMWLEFHYKDTSEQPYNGHLFSVLLTDKDDYTIIPDHDLLGELTDQEGNVYHVVSVYPTDVQYSKENKDSYMALFGEADAILDTLKAADGCSFTKAEEMSKKSSESEKK